jgi:hypothetical protein
MTEIYFSQFLKWDVHHQIQFLWFLSGHSVCVLTGGRETSVLFSNLQVTDGGHEDSTLTSHLA